MDFRDKNRVTMFCGRCHWQVVFFMILDSKLAGAEKETQQIVHTAINALLDVEMGHCHKYNGDDKLINRSRTFDLSTLLKKGEVP